MKYTKKEIKEAWGIIEQYRDARLKAVVMSVSSTGMSRRMRFYAAVLDREGKPYMSDITYLIARLADYSMNDVGLRADGCGMDMCFSVISNFNYTAWAHDCKARFPDTDWELIGTMGPEACKLMGKEPDYRIYGDYFFDANRM